MTGPHRPLELDRPAILAHRLRIGALDERLPPSADSLRRAAWVGLADSMPRAALLSIHARVAGTPPDAWADPALVQVWGPRFSAYVVAADAVAPFTLGRLSDDAAKRQFAQDTADQVEAFLAGRTMTYGEAGRALGRNPNSLRYAAPTGRVRIRWEGARQPTIWTVPAPDVDPHEARLDLARRYLHVLGPTTPAAFEAWAGIRSPGGRGAFRDLDAELVAVRTRIGEGWILADDEASLRSRARPRSATSVRLLPSGDAYWLLWGADRELLVPEAAHRPALWTPRVWPGAVLLGDEIVGIWRRDAAKLTIATWRSLTGLERDAVVAEAESLPLPDVAGPIRVSWES
jgi:Winged helix DNA-binding domain